MKKSLLIVLSSVAISSLAAFGIVKAAAPESAVIPGTTDAGTFRTVNLSESEYPDFTFAAENSVDAVVYVEVTVKSMQQPYQLNDPFFRFFFGDGGMAPQSREQRGSGSGVIIRQDGYIVTNNHVVQNATKINVTMNNNKTYEAKVIGTDPATDVALIKVEADGLPYIEFADSDKLRLGEWVLAIGSPLGEQLRSTITAGIVSAKGRSMPNYDGQFKIESFIQTDAAVNPGNSGGALVNKSGKLVGINTAIVSTTGSYSGYSFAVPSNIVSKIVGDLIDFGSVRRVMLGITGGTVTGEIARELKLSSPAGVYISEVSKGSSADEAGLKAKDVIIQVDSAKITSMPDLQAKVNGYRPGDKAAVKVIRGGTEKLFDITFKVSDGNEGTLPDGSVVFYGATLKAAQGGVEIVSAGNGKVAQAGGEDGFLIQYVNDRRVSKPQEVVEAAKKSKRSVFIEGITASGRQACFGFGKTE